MATDLASAVLQYFAELFGPLTALDDSDGLASLLAAAGWDGQALGVTDPNVFAAAGAALETVLDTFDQVLDQDDVELADVAEALAALGLAAVSAVQALTSLPPPPGGPSDALATLGGDLLQYLFATQFVSRFPRLAVAAFLLGVLTQAETEAVTTAAGLVLRQPTTQYGVDLAAVGKAFSDPLAYLRAAFLVDSGGTRRLAEALADLIGPDLATALLCTGLGAGYGIVPLNTSTVLTPAEQDAAKHLLLVAARLPAGPQGSLAALSVALGLTDDTQPGEGLGLLAAASGEVSLSVPTSNGTLSAALSGALQPLVITGQSVRLASSTATAPTLTIQVTYASDTAAAPAVRLGSAGSRLEVNNVTVTVRVTADASGVDVAGTADLTGILLAVSGSDGDGFLSSVLPSNPVEASGDLGLDISLRKGLRVRGGGGLEWQLGVSKTIGPLVISEMQASLRSADGSLSMTLSASLSLSLGPLTASVDAVGLQAALAAPASGQPAPGLNVGFKPPQGIGLGLDSSLVTGGGYLFADPAAGLYAGAAELQLETIGLSAVGLLATKLPGGRAGFSLVVLVSVTFPPVELGFGFALTGVGGLVAVNSTVNVTALQSGLAAGSLDAVLFPADVASNAQRVVASLEQYFPAAPGQFVVGPAVQIIWGEDGIFTASIGVFVEFPSPLRVVLLGQLDVALPTAGEAIAEIELDVLGVVDFTARTLGLNAVLRNSHVAGFALTGAAALRASWGGQPGFLFAAGGFSPRFTPPASFPRLDPLALSLCTSDNPRLRVSAYLAVSSNTVQVGGLLDFSARVDLLLGTLGVAATLGIDTLFQLRPFAFFIDLHAMVAVTWNDNPVLSAQVDGTFTGPSPLYLAATATVHYLGTHHVHVELTIPGSDAPPPPPPPAVDAAAELRDALGQPSAWHSDPPPGGQHLVRLAGTPSQGGTVAVHPLGVLTVRQRRLPLGQAIQQLGTGTLASPTAFTITAATVGQQLIPSPPTVQDYFARGQFFALSDADKMSAPSFELMDAGVSVSSAATQVSGGQVTVNAAFTSILVPPAGGQAVTQNGKVLPDSLLAACARSAPPRGPGSVAAGYLGGPPQVTLSRPGYTFATAALTSPDPGQPPQRFATYSQAASQLAAGDAAATQVVFADEVVTGPPAPAGPPLVPRPPVTGIITPVIPPARVQPFPPPLPPSPVQVA